MVIEEYGMVNGAEWGVYTTDKDFSNALMKDDDDNPVWIGYNHEQTSEMVTARLEEMYELSADEAAAKAEIIINEARESGKGISLDKEVEAADNPADGVEMYVRAEAITEKGDEVSESIVVRSPRDAKEYESSVELVIEKLLTKIYGVDADYGELDMDLECTGVDHAFCYEAEFSNDLGDLSITVQVSRHVD